ncbi:MAG: helix-turn-helix transcriptional regulator [Lachnospiraceae bacterium]|nr:helix-turn-helix transcriptional regulator [Lachnospiraceae bacterium]
MNIGQKIKQLRFQHSLTQDQLAEKLGISAQAISKWENSVSMPDISILPALSEAFGVSIDELFDLADDQKMRRIENRMQTDDDISPELFQEYETFLKEQMDKDNGDPSAVNLLARLYHHKMESYGRKAGAYARKAISRSPGEKDCQWILQKAEGASIWDWNIANHSKTIDFYKSVIESITDSPQPALPYHYLIEELIADHRTPEAKEYLGRLRKLPTNKPMLIPLYEAMIALAEYDEHTADAVIEKALTAYDGNADMYYQAAQYYARKCDYDKAVKLYDASYTAGEDKKPRFTDALEGIAMIYEILKDYENAVATKKRILEALKNEWGYSDEEVYYRNTVHDIERLKQMMV